MRTSYKTSPPKPPIPPYNLPQGSLLLSLMIGVGCCLLCILEKLLKLLLLYFGGSKGIFGVDSLLCHMLQTSVKLVRFPLLRLELCRQLCLLGDEYSDLNTEMLIALPSPSARWCTGPMLASSIRTGSGCVCVCVCVCVLV